MSRTARALARIDAQLAEIQHFVTSSPALLDLRVESVSRWSIRLQLDHILKVLAVGLRALAGEAPRLPRGINLTGRFLLALDWLPRGLGKSPKRVLPTETPDAELLAEIERVAAAYRALDAEHPRFADPAPIFAHPYFGGLSARQGARMLGTHTHHHWKIVCDIRTTGEARSSGR